MRPSGKSGMCVIGDCNSIKGLPSLLGSYIDKPTWGYRNTEEVSFWGQLQSGVRCLGGFILACTCVYVYLFTVFRKFSRLGLSSRFGLQVQPRFKSQLCPKVQPHKKGI